MVWKLLVHVVTILSGITFSKETGKKYNAVHNVADEWWNIFEYCNHEFILAKIKALNRLSIFILVLRIKKTIHPNVERWYYILIKIWLHHTEINIADQISTLHWYFLITLLFFKTNAYFMWQHVMHISQNKNAILVLINIENALWQYGNMCNNYIGYNTVNAYF